MESVGLIATGLSLKLVGAIAGAILALVFSPPRTRNGFVRRSVISLLSGLIFADPVRDRLGWPETWQMELAAATATAMLSWFVWGALVRIIGGWKPK